MYFHVNCMINMNMEMRKVTTNGPIKDFILKRVSFFTYCKYISKVVNEINIGKFEKPQENSCFKKGNACTVRVFGFLS